MSRTLNEELTALKLTTWKQDIMERFSVDATRSSIDYIMGFDFTKDDLPWIREKLVPWLRATEQGMKATIYYTGTSPGCDCWGTCEHCEGRTLTISLS